MDERINPVSLETLAGALAYAMGIQPPEHAAEPNRTLTDYVDRMLAGKKADRIFVVDDKQILEAGTHAQLLAAKGHYYNLYQAQFKNLQ